MELTSEQIENLGKLHGEIKGMREDLKDIKKDIKEIFKATQVNAKEIGKIKTVAKTVATIIGALWASITFWGGK